MLTHRLHVRLQMELVLRLHHLLPDLFVAPVVELLAHERRPVPDACGLAQPSEPHQAAVEPAGRYALEPLEEVAERTLRFSILWTVSRSYPVSLPWVLGTALAAPFPPFPDMASSDLPGPADPALRVSDSQIYPYMCG